ncbi:MAG: hypothetical protein MJ210_01710 [Alphaproteobacteria bacterium]|nr:hypothetical protein [Alphaproteobacteria bacterium]
MNKLKLIKALVFFMTFLLCSGIIYFGMLIHQRFSSVKDGNAEISLNQPQGSYIADFRTDADNLYILIKGGNTADRIIRVNTKNQKLNTQIKIY